MSELEDIQREIEYQKNSASYDKESDMHTTHLVNKYKRINLYLFYLFYIVLFMLAGIWVFRHFQTLTSVRPILMFIGIMGILILYPLWAHLLFSVVIQIVQFIWANIRNFFS